ncbi:acyl-CoA dehydrogenase [Vulcanibacillus modesticaldus]|uniref:Acyl-CoA dehydrogenase n=1 Tax=Vulcanibacillus modesticaldus TaxID=337097 RepID=A0A1D2YS95_9BACI|nr:acyl-CoA dehydrogenase family protein [Vulcanibacillus modesticaldus]OEF96929.1 acyl-CoA dehydrogenase [Vulcanibacillus modesticaldus]
MEEKRIIKGGSFLIDELQPEDIFTPEDFTDEHKMIAKTTSDFVEGEIIPNIEAVENKDYDFIVGKLKEAGELGLLGVDVPEEYGGIGLDKISSSLITENFGKSGSFALAHGAHVGIGSLPIVFFGNEEQRQKYLPALATGEKIAAYALTEPSSGSDALGAKTTAVLSEDGKYYILNGTKQFITNAGFADIFVVYAKVDGEKFTAFIVEREFEGVSVGPEEKKMGIRGSSTRPLILEDVKVPVENVLGEIGRGHVIAFNILNIGRYKLGVGTVGSSKRVIELATKYAKERKQFKVPIASFRLIQEKLADMAITTYVNESMIYRTGGLIEDILSSLEGDKEDEGRKVASGIAEYAIECSINKVYGSESFDFVADEGVQIHGGYGFIEEYEVERAYRDSRINRIFEGTNEINRLLIPATLLRKAMKGEIPLLAAAERLQKELMTLMPFMPDDAPLSKEKNLLSMSKKLFLMVAGLAVQKYQKEIESEQEILKNISDMIIEIYAMESAILRTLKAIGRSSIEKEELKLDMTQVYVQEAFERIADIAKTTLAAMEEGDMLKTQLSIHKKLTRNTPINTVTLKRKIAKRIIDAEKYTV